MLREVRLGLALNGGVSLAIWIGGVADELLRAVSAGKGHPEAQPEWVDLCRELDLVVEIDVVVGTSAGGVNGAFLAAGLANDAAEPRRPAEPLDRRPATSPSCCTRRVTAGIRSLLRGDTFFLPQPSAGPRGGGRERPRRARARPAARHPAHLDRPARQGRRASPTASPCCTASTTRSSSASPTRTSTSAAHAQRVRPGGARVPLDRVLPGRLRGEPDPRRASSSPATPRRSRSTASVAPTYLVDGGVLNNLPARNAVDAIAAQPAGERVHRVLALVVPDPGRPSQEAEELVEPLLGRTVGQSAVGIPRNQSLSAFSAEVRNHNNDVLSRRAARTAFLGELGELRPAAAWARFTRRRRGAVPVLPRRPAPPLVSTGCSPASATGSPRSSPTC